MKSQTDVFARATAPSDHGTQPRSWDTHNMTPTPTTDKTRSDTLEAVARVITEAFTGVPRHRSPPWAKEAAARILNLLQTGEQETEGWRLDQKAVRRLIGRKLGPHLAISPTPKYEAVINDFIRGLQALAAAPPSPDSQRGGDR